MTAIPFDTLEFASELIQEGIPSNQANVIAKAVCKRLSISNADVIEQVKHDYKLDDVTTNKDLDARLRETEHLFMSKIEASRVDSIKWFAAILIGTLTTQTAAIIGILKLLGKL